MELKRLPQDKEILIPSNLVAEYRLAKAKGRKATQERKTAFEATHFYT